MSLQIVGLGAVVPSLVVDNEKLSDWVDTSDEWIQTRTGIRTRHIAMGESMLDMALSASRQALSEAGMRGNEMDMILCATIRNDDITPSLAATLAGPLEASCAAMDVNAACCGFIAALDIAAAYIGSGRAKRILVIAIESMHHLVNWQDRATCVLFGDGCGAAVVTEGSDLLATHMHCQSDRDSLYIPHVRSNFPLESGSAPDTVLTMNGQAVYRFAVGAMVSGVKKVVEDAGLAMEDVDWVVPHQANLRIIEAAANRLKVPLEKCAQTVSEYGNTSASSIPLALMSMREAGKLKSGQIVVLSAFGAGLLSASCVIRWR